MEQTELAKKVVAILYKVALDYEVNQSGKAIDKAVEELVALIDQVRKETLEEVFEWLRMARYSTPKNGKLSWNELKETYLKSLSDQSKGEAK